jgi:hypothetical protein
MTKKTNTHWFRRLFREMAYVLLGTILSAGLGLGLAATLCPSVADRKQDLSQLNKAQMYREWDLIGGTIIGGFIGLVATSFIVAHRVSTCD